MRSFIVTAVAALLCSALAVAAPQACARSRNVAARASQGARALRSNLLFAACLLLPAAAGAKEILTNETFYEIDGVVARISTGGNGRALRFPGTAGNYVRVPIGANAIDDFDVGNYMTVSAWFRTAATPTYSRLDHAFAPGRYADNLWHLATDTHNRFGPDGRRIKLYIDGEKVMEGAGAGLPILRGENQLVVGKYSVGGFFQGDIDDTMTGAEVKRLWQERLKRGAP